MKIGNPASVAAAILGLFASLQAMPAAAALEGCDPGQSVCLAPTAPEPATLSLLALGVAGAAIARRRR